MDCNFDCIFCYLCKREKIWPLSHHASFVYTISFNNRRHTAVSSYSSHQFFFLCFFPQSVHHSWRSSVFTQASWLFPYTLESELLWGRCRFKWLCLRVTSMSNSSSPPPLMGHPRLIYSSKYRFDFFLKLNALFILH